MFGKSLKLKVEELHKELNSALAINTAFKKEIEQYKGEIESFAEVKKDLTKKITAQKSELDGIKSKHQDEMVKLENSVNRRVNSSLASIGVNQFAPELIQENSKSDGEILAKFNSLSGNEKTEFYNKYKAAITRALLNQ